MSGLIPRPFIDDLLTRIDLVDVVDSRISLKKAGANYTACCPFHHEKTPSFIVSPAKQIYHCFGCGAGGNAIGFVMQYERLEFVGAVEVLANQLGISVPRETNTNSPKNSNHFPNFSDLQNVLAKVAAYYQEQLRLNSAAIAYLKQRHLNGETAKRYGIGYAPGKKQHLSDYFQRHPNTLMQLEKTGMLIKKSHHYYQERFQERIMFPIRDRRGYVIGFGGRVFGEGFPKYLNSPETPLFHKGKELYGLYEALQCNKELIQAVVVEGYMDVVMLAQHGISYAVATLGTATSVTHVKQLMKLTKEIIFCFDGDNAGQTAAWRAMETILPVMQDGVQIRFLLLPAGEDPDSLIKKEGKEIFEERIKKALTLSDFLFNRLLEKADLSHLDGKAHFTQQIGHYLNKLPECIFKHMMFERLEKLVGINQDKLKRMLNKGPALSNKMAFSPPAVREKKHSLMRLVISLLLQYPELHVIALHEKTKLQQLLLPGQKLLNGLIEQLTSSLQWNTATILEYWRGKPEYDQLCKLAFYEHTIPVEGISQEFTGAIQRLIQLNNEFLIEKLMLKAQQIGLQAEEKYQLQQLMKEKMK